ncbi:hypothetical protein [Vallitalea guaymasensis]|uniref:hypothetical protein n=1 Tax=Vallitalea guaymasensis TaxID=1185412 RepID=UPI00235337BE|nr:hypothetical protein [Vallitalea guaymasensis]
MKCSTSIVTLSSNREIFRKINGENFLVSKVIVEGIEIPAVGSEYILGNLQGRVEVKYYLRSETTADNKLFTFMYIITAKQVINNIPERNYIQVGGYVVKTKGLLIKNNTCMEILPFIVKYKSYDGNYNVAHCVAKGAKARELAKMKKGDIVEVTGKFKKEHNTLEVLVEEVDFYKAYNKLKIS